MVGKFNRDAFQKASEQRKSVKAGSGADRLPFLKPPKGQSLWKLLPPWDVKQELPYAEYYIHFVSDDVGNKKSYKCAGKNCPICREAFAAKDAENTTKFNALKRKKQVYYNALNLETKQMVILVVGPQLQESIEEEVNDTAVDIFDLTNNFVVRIKRTGEDLQTRYKAKVLESSFDPSMVDLAKMSDLSKIHAEYNPQQIAQAAPVAQPKNSAPIAHIAKAKPVNEDADDFDDETVNMTQEELDKIKREIGED